MALPVIGEDFITPIDAALVRKALTAGGKLDCKVLWATIAYDGAAWIIATGIDSAEIVAGNLVWNVDRVELTLTGYTAKPTVLASQAAAVVPYLVQAEATAPELIVVQFWTHAGVLVTAEDTSMRASIIVIGA